MVIYLPSPDSKNPAILPTLYVWNLYSTRPRNWAVLETGTLQSPSDRKFKSGDTEILSLSTQDTHRQTDKNTRRCNSQGWCNFNIYTGQFLLSTELIFTHWCCSVLFKATQTKSLSLRTLKFCQYQHETHKDKQKKLQGAATLRDDAILIFKLVNFCCSKSEIRSLVQYITKLLRQKV
jgi:hypothetical protein